jgi:hypothetical protein
MVVVSIHEILLVSEQEAGQVAHSVLVRDIRH